MKEFKEIVEVMKDIISRDVKGKVLDAHIAKELRVSSTQLATNKNRGVIMYAQIAEFCARKRIAINALLFDQSAESLVDPTNALYANRYNIAV